jgi:hypothetical protein
MSKSGKFKNVLWMARGRVVLRVIKGKTVRLRGGEKGPICRFKEAVRRER